ncbi:MAG: NAD-binding protein [Candidatus Bathyarchaeia archaeon]|jgi:voltage-gated potassium channel
MNASDDILSSRPVKRRSIKKESRKFSFIFYQALYGPFVFVKAIYSQIILLGLMFVWGAAIFSYFGHLPVLSSLLASVSTITTIGLCVPNGGNFVTMNHVEIVLLIIMIITSVGAGASIVQSSVNTVVNGDLGKGEAEKTLIKKLKKHVIVFGYSHLGRYVVEKLGDLGFDYVVLTRDPNIYHELLKKDIFAVLEYETQPMTSLKAAGIDHAAIVIVAHDKDPDNMLVILSARKLRPDIRIISVVHDQSLIETAKNAGADMVIPSSVTVGHLLALSAVTKDLVGVVFSEKIGTQEIAEFSIFKASKLVGKGLQEISKFATVIGVVRDTKVVTNIFDPSFRLKENDTLLVLGDPANLLTLEEEAKAL